MATGETVPLAGLDLNEAVRQQSQRTEELLHGILLELRNLNINLRKRDELPSEPLSSAAEIAVQASLEALARVGIQSDKVEEKRQGDVGVDRSSSSLNQQLDVGSIDADIEGDENDQDDMYSYHWQVPVHMPGWEDTLEQPSEAICDEWSRIMPTWGIPPDGRLRLSFETNVLQQAHMRELEKQYLVY